MTTSDKRDMGNVTQGERRSALASAEPMPPPPAPAEVGVVRSRAKPLAELYGLNELARDSTLETVSLATLPPWPSKKAAAGKSATDGWSEWGHGVGKALATELGGLRPGTMIGVGAAAAKSGKTAWVHQVADGLALRSAKLLKGGAPGLPLTPVVVFSEMRPSDLTFRTLGRWTGHPASHFREGRQAPNAERLWADAEWALKDGPLAEARQLIHYLPAGPTGDELIEALRAAVADARKAMQEHLGDRECWPVVMIDPVQRCADSGREGIGAMDDFLKALDVVARAEGWIVLLTSDATKSTAKGEATKDDPAQEGAAVFRGSYTLQHVLDSALYLRPKKADVQRNDGVREMEMVSVFSRWGTGGKAFPFEFHGRTMRMIPGRVDGDGARGAHGPEDGEDVP